MNARQGHGRNAVVERHKSRFANRGNSAEILSFSERSLGQSYPRHYPHPEEAQFPLGEPMAIEDVAMMLGCSVWTVRQKYLPQGLPHLRASSAGRFVFFRQQVTDWILERQSKGGMK